MSAACSHGKTLRISAWASRAARATAPSPSFVQPPCHVLQECRALRGCKRCREFAQECDLLMAEVKSVHVLRYVLRAMARSTACTNRLSIRISSSRDQPPTISSPGCVGVLLPFRYMDLRPRLSSDMHAPRRRKSGKWRA